MAAFFNHFCCQRNISGDHKITSLGREGGAEAIALTCPLCRYNLDVRGKEGEAFIEGHKQLPVLYYTQLLALALGLGPESCGFETNAVDPLPLLKEKGVA